MSKHPTVALVLGAGSARGLAHIGVLQVLQEHRLPVDLIVGSSMGAMIGGIYGCGTDLYRLDKMIEVIDTSLFMDIRVPRLGFVAGKRISYFLELLTKKKTFDDLLIPVLVVATDLIKGERVVLEEGSVAEAIRASIAVPGIIFPVKKNGMVLVDGAVIDRLPVDVARERGADIVIAVDITFTPDKVVEINNTLDVIMTSLDIMSRHHFDTVQPQADILIQPAVGQINSRDWSKSRAAVDAGRKATEDKIAEIKGKLG